MKCPKCGSYRLNTYFNGMIQCLGCSYIVRTVKQAKYQARLDKVTNWDRDWGLPNGISIEWYIGTDTTRFYLCGDNVFSNPRLEISLETVESLLKDIDK